MSINHEKLATYANVLDLDGRPGLSHTEEHHLLGRGDDTLAYFLLLDSINFGSGYFPFLKKNEGASGYFTIAKKLKEWILSEGVPKPQYLCGMTSVDCARVFQQDLETPHAKELMSLFAHALNQLGVWTTEEFDGSYVAVFNQAETAEDVVDSVMRMPFYQDVAVYENIAIPFLKRAQILVQDVSVAEPTDPRLQFADLEQLTVFADNVLPYVLKADGVLEYDPWLAGRIQREELIGAGSCEEIEIRACTIHAVEILCTQLKRRIPLTIRELDFHLWNRGQALKSRVPDLRHRTRCVYY